MTCSDAIGTARLRSYSASEPRRTTLRTRSMTFDPQGTMVRQTAVLSCSAAVPDRS
jgi:hypothetical protein